MAEVEAAPIEKKKRSKAPKSPSKRFKAAKAKVPESPVALEEAIKLLKSFDGSTKFDQTIEIAMRLGIDAKQADQLVRGSIVLPHGIGKSQRVVVFAKGEAAEAASAAGADEVGQEDLAEKIKGGWLDFDVCIAAPDMMGLVGPLGRVLGPRGLMPSPRAGTVTPDVAKVVEEYKAGKVEFRNDSAGVVHAQAGKLSFDADKIQDNLQAFIDHIRSLQPQTLKGTYIKGISVSATMSPGIQVAA